MIANHDWRLVAPWYHWQRQFDDSGVKAWQSRPVFQKFDDNEFVKTFTLDPQRSLKFIDTYDRVFNTSLKDAPVVSGGALAGKFTQLYAPKQASGAKTTAQEAALAPTGIRKLYLPTHKRSYLVVSELHCYAPGFPRVMPEQVCQSGIVVRRRILIIPEADKKKAQDEFIKIMGEINGARAELAYWQQTTPAAGLRGKRRDAAVQKAKTNGTYDAKVAAAQSSITTAQQKLVNWRAKYNVTAELQGWIPGDFEHIGSWQKVEETPAQTAKEPFPANESSFPMFALFPDPKLPKHSAAGRTIYFGVVPATSLDTDTYGAPRFDDDAQYEIRCFVRRHKADCPRKDQAPDCHGEIVWSEPTEVYKLASASDLIGTANRPITIKLPDLSELAAQAAALPATQLAPVRMVQPQAMKFNVDGDGKPTGGGIGGFQICFISIPLITIVAMFLFQLFLPIVVFLFGLFFLLQLKFCIPPSLSLSAGLSVELDAVMPKLELDASIDVDVDIPGIGFTADTFQTDFKAGITKENSITDADDQLEAFGNSAMMPIGENIQFAKDSTVDGQPKPEVGSDLKGSLELEARVEVTVK
jgi:hypothetical protein